MEITINETGLTILFGIFFLIALYVFAVLCFLTYRIYKRIVYGEKIIVSKLFKDPLIGFADIIAYMFVGVIRLFV